MGGDTNKKGNNRRLSGDMGITSLIRPGEVHKMIIVRTKKGIRRKDGSYIRFDENAGIIINNNGLPKATRIHGPIPYEFFKLNPKLFTLSKLHF